ncbi:MAG: hypothetical protein ACRYG7_24355 [Janthinobacterium lividum]
MSASQLAEDIANLPAKLQEEVQDFVTFLKIKVQKRRLDITRDSIKSI